MIIGITGVVGSGKSTIVNYINEICDCLVLDTDSIAKELMEPGMVAYDEIVKTFGYSILTESDVINRKTLAEIVFNDKGKLELLNNITHHLVIEEVKNRIKKSEKKLIVIESALLFDTPLKDLCDSCWVIITSYEEKKKRLMLNRGYTEEKVDAMIASQKTNEELSKLADIIIKNDILDDAKQEVEKNLKNFKKNT